MTNSRQKILNYIIEHQSVTAEELSKAFRVTPANIRHHLSILVQQGSIRVVGQKADKIRGRPSQIYSSSQQNDHNNLDRLSDILLNTILQNRNQADKEQAIREIAHLIGHDYHNEINNPTSRLYTAVRSLNRMGYQAHWEAHIQHPRLMLDHCPYRQILDKHPELCQMDVYLLADLVSAPVIQVERLTQNTKGLPHCVFLISKPM